MLVIAVASQQLTRRGESCAVSTEKYSSIQKKISLISNAGFGRLAGKAEDGAELTHSEKQGGMLEKLLSVTYCRAVISRERETVMDLAGMIYA